MAVRVSLVVLMFSGVGYFYLSTHIERLALDSLARYVHERGQRERIPFQQAKMNHNAFKKNFETRMRAAKNLNLSPQFDAIIQRTPDGAYRSRAFVKDSEHVSIFLGPQTQLTQALKNRVVVLHDMVSEYGPAWRTFFQDTYVSLRENGVIVYWPEVPRWADQAKSDFDVTKEEYFYVADKQHNPARETVWTDVFYDSIGKVWMSSAETPIDSANGEMVSVVGHDIMVDEIIARTLGDHLPGAYNIIFRGDGHLIAHPDYLEEIKRRNGNFDISRTATPALASLYDLVKSEATRNDIFEVKSLSAYAGVYYVPESDWYFVTIYPKSLIQATAREVVFPIVILGFISLAVELLVLAALLRARVAKPLASLLSAVHEIGRGSRQIQLATDRDDEVGQLASSFNQMAIRLIEHEARLENHKAWLEEQMMLRTQELEQERAVTIQSARMASLGMMAGGIAHEINSPLAIISMSAECLDQLLEKDLAAQPGARKHLQTIINTIDRISSIVKGLRTFSRDETKSSFEVVAISKIVNDTLFFCRHRLMKDNIDLKTATLPEDVLVECQPTQISQVLLNLLNNACDAVASLSERWISIELEAQKEKALLRVTDSGPGLPVDVAKRLFQPFFTTKPVGKGTGFGLSLSLQIMEKHGGRLYLNRESTHTQFIVELSVRARAQGQENESKTA